MPALAPSNQPLILATAVFAAAGLAMSAHGAVTDPALTIRAQAGAAVDIITVPLASLAPGLEVGSLQYVLPAPMFLANTGTWLQQLTLSYVPENAIPPQENLISLGYTLWTGPNATTFTISSGEFTPGAPAFFGRGATGVTLTDGHDLGDPDGSAQYLGLQPGGGGFHTQFDGGFGPDPLYTPLGTAFAELGPSALNVIDFAQTAAGDDSIGYTFLGGPVNSMSSQWRFSVSANDQLGVVSTFFSSTIIPGPGAAALLAIGGVIVGRRRR